MRKNNELFSGHLKNKEILIYKEKSHPCTGILTNFRFSDGCTKIKYFNLLRSATGPKIKIFVILRIFIEDPQDSPLSLQSFLSYFGILRLILRILRILIEDPEDSRLNFDNHSDFGVLMILRIFIEGSFT